MNLKLKVLGLALSVGLTSCMTYDPYTGEQKVSDATTGAVVGAVAGTVIGNQVKGDKKTRQNARVAGAVAGAAIGGGIGGYMDKQEAQLRQKLKASGVSVTRKGDLIILNMPGAITFETGKSTINGSFYDVLDSVALVLKEFDKTNVEVAGHTDNKGSPQNNQTLSEQRANSVSSYLRTKGVSQKRLIASGYGQSNPVADNNSEEGRTQNRRVEITLTPKGE